MKLTKHSGPRDFLKILKMSRLFSRNIRCDSGVLFESDNTLYSGISEPIVKAAKMAW